MSEKTDPQPSASISIETGDIKVSVSATGPNAVEDAERLFEKALDYIDATDESDED